MRAIILFVFTIILDQSTAGPEQYRKCCPDNEFLNLQGSCISTPSKHLQRYVAGFTGEGTGFPSCRNRKTYKIFSDPGNVNDTDRATIDKNGELVTKGYNLPVQAKDFCLDLREDSQEVGVACDLCKQGISCINLCCPKGQITGSDDEGFPICVDATVMIQLNIYSQKTNDESARVELSNWKEGEHYALIPQKDYFYCPDKEGRPGNLFDIDLEYQDKIPYIIASGDLVNVADEYLSTYVDTLYLDAPTAEYCIRVEKGNETFIMYSACHYEPIDSCEATRVTIVRFGFGLSLIFIMLTIIAHLIEPALHGSNFGKMSIGLLVNIFIAFGVILDLRIEEHEAETFRCVLIGYLIQYFFLAFFVWMNAISIFFWKSLSGMQVERGSKKVLLYSTIYAQGLPLIICLVTFIVDQYRPVDVSPDDPALIPYPQMGVFDCYPGHFQTNNTLYFQTPEFIYLESVQLLMLLSNLILFCLTSYIIFNRMTPGFTPGSTDDVWKRRKENFVIVFKLYVYMFCTWIFESVGTALAIKSGNVEDNCEIRLVIDIPNIFYGLIIFFVLVCSKKPVVRALRQTITSIFTNSTEVPASTASSKGPIKTDNQIQMTSTQSKDRGHL